MVDLLFLTYNRREFTEASLGCLVANTDWDLVRRVYAYDDGSADGTRELVRSVEWPVPVIHSGAIKLGGPVQVMLDYLSKESDQPGFCKLDSDVIVPPGWLDRCARVMDENPQLEILGIEPPLSRTPAPWRNGRREHAPELAENCGSGYAPCSAIGGIGMMRRSAFASRPKMLPHSIYGGFTEWQIVHARHKGWIVPPLNLFLLDRLPFEPWCSLSKQYIANGWQRPWTNYRMEDSALWEWWVKKEQVAA